MNTIRQILCVALGGSVGAVARFGLSRLVATILPSLFPWGTMAINLSGCFAIGLLYEVFEETLAPAELKSLLSIGFLGAFTTFSTFSLETLNLLRDGERLLAAANVLVSVVFGVALTLLGIVVARALLRAVR